MKQYTHTISVNGWINVDTALRAATPAYTGDKLVKSFTMVNNSGTAAYLHFAGASQPATAANGLLVSTAGAGAAYTAENVDLLMTWVNTGGALSITFSIIGF